jgi:hypothetical protein
MWVVLGGWSSAVWPFEVLVDISTFKLATHKLRVEQSVVRVSLWHFVDETDMGFVESVYTKSSWPKRPSLVSWPIGGRSASDRRQLVFVHFCNWNASSEFHDQSGGCFKYASCVCVKTCVCIQTEPCTKSERKDQRSWGRFRTWETWIPWGSAILSGYSFEVCTLLFWLQSIIHHYVL